MIPALETRRLILRAFREADFPAYAAFWDSDLALHVGGRCGRADAWRRMAMYAGHWLLRGYGIWAMESRADGAFLGQCGLWFPEAWPEPEIHWLLLAQAQGQGFATEAALAVRAHAYGALAWRSVVSCIAPGNAASIRVAERLGARAEREVQVGERRLVVWRHPPAETAVTPGS